MDGVRRNLHRLGPLEEEARDGVMERLVRRPERSDHVVVDAAVNDRGGHGSASGDITALLPCDEERSLGMRMEPMNCFQQLVARHSSEPLG